MYRNSEYLENIVLPHKIAVFKAGLEILENSKIKLLLDVTSNSRLRYEFKKNLWSHDMSKLSALETIAYSSYNFKNKTKNSVSTKTYFAKAVNHHYNNNPHHPEYWIMTNKDGSIKKL